MRLSPWRVAKAITLSCACLLFVLFNKFHAGLPKSFSEVETEKSPRSLRQNQHGRVDPLWGKPVASKDIHGNPGSKHSRNQRSAMSLPEDRDRTQKINDPVRSVDSKSLEHGHVVNKIKNFQNQRDNDNILKIRKTELFDIFISVKTSRRLHQSRCQLLLDTWVNFAKDQTYFFTDAEDEEFTSQIKKGHIINTNCSNTHSRQDLCCKMAVEFDTFLLSEKSCVWERTKRGATGSNNKTNMYSADQAVTLRKGSNGQHGYICLIELEWFCHFDDDVYVNVPELARTLRDYNYMEDWYLGKPSTRFPMEIHDHENPGMKIAYWFATGSGLCISRGLALKMMPYASGGRLKTLCDKIRLPDDCTLGYIIGHLLKKKLTVVKKFHSHLEGLVFVTPATLKSQISFSYIKSKSGSMNAVSISGFSSKEDPSRFKTIHCHLYPYLNTCKDMKS